MHSEARSPGSAANKATRQGPSPAGEGGRLTLGLGAEEEGDEQQQRPACGHHPAAGQQRALAPCGHRLGSCSESVRSETPAGTLSEPGRAEGEKKERKHRDA